MFDIVYRQPLAACGNVARGKLMVAQQLAGFSRRLAGRRVALRCRSGSGNGFIGTFAEPQQHASDRDDVVGRVHAKLVQDPKDPYRFELTDLNSRIRGVNEGPDGALYVMTDGLDGKILRLVPKK